MRTAERLNEITAHNVANVQTPGFRAQRAEVLEVESGGSRVGPVQQDTRPGYPLLDPIPGTPTTSSNVDLTTELTNQLLGTRMFQANAAMVRAQNGLLDDLLDLRG
jgi:flagellar hook protein FlgE